MAMVSASNTDPTLTAPSQRATQEPLTAAHRLQHVTYFRLEGTDFSDGAGAAAFMRTDLHLGAYFLVKDTGEGFPVPQYEAMGMDSYARGHLGMKRTGEGQLDWSDPDALVRSEKTVATRIARRRPPGVFCACSSDSSAGLVEQLRAHGYRKPVVIGEIGYDPHTVIQVGAAYHNLYTAGIETVDPSQASPAFQRAFRRTFHTSLLSFDASAYDAASLVLNAVYRAARDGSYHGTIESKRLTVLNRVATSRYRGVSGPISFDRNGDNVLGRVSIYVARYKRWTFLTVAPPTPGALRTG
jgi:branched-chain amino acid transport system substrate-binding protein